MSPTVEELSRGVAYITTCTELWEHMKTCPTCKQAKKELMEEARAALKKTYLTYYMERENLLFDALFDQHTTLVFELVRQIDYLFGLAKKQGLLDFPSC